MTECLNPESRDSAYLCGRLFAVFDRLQRLAQGNVNAGVVERYYASASVTPALVMGRLFRNAQFHLAKAEGGVATNVGRDRGALVVEHVAQHDRGTLGREHAGLDLALPASSARDDRDLAVEPTHVIPLGERLRTRTI